MPRVLVSVLVASLAFASASQAAGLVRTPYVQDVRTDSALIAFRLDASCDAAKVSYGPQGASLDRTATSSGKGSQHGIRLPALASATAYSYKVEACGATFGPRTFVTASGPEARRVHFAVTGDFGTGGKDQRAVAAAMHGAKPELWLALGDNAYEDGTEAEFQSRYFVPMAALNAEVPAYLVFGNHDYLTNQGQPQIDAFYMPTNNPRGTERYYSFNWGPVHFVALDSQCYQGWTTTPECKPAEQKAWLEADLAANSQPWTVVFMHHPPYSSGDHGNATRTHDLLPIFEAHGVDMVLSGHDHDYERMHPLRGGKVVSADQGVPYWVVGTGGVGIKRFAVGQPSITAFRNDSNHGFLDVVVDGGALTARFVTPDGRVLDSYSRTKSVPDAPTLTLSARTVPDKPLTTVLRATTNLPDAEVQWTLGDGATPRGLEITHTWEAARTWEVKATAIGSDGRRAEATLSLEVTSAGSTPVDTPDGGAGSDEGQTPPPGDVPPPPGGGVVTGGDDGPSGCQAAPAAVLVPLALVGVPALIRQRRRRSRD